MTSSYDTLIKLIKERNLPYPLQAYAFTLEVFEWLLTICNRKIDGAAVSRAAVIYSIRKFGLLSETVWKEYKIEKSEDIGKIIFCLVDSGLLTKNDDDKVGDFDNIVSIDSLKVLKYNIENDNTLRYNVVLKNEFGQEEEFVI